MPPKNEQATILETAKLTFKSDLNMENIMYTSKPVTKIITSDS